jgi:hypothetical protein
MTQQNMNDQIPVSDYPDFLPMRYTEAQTKECMDYLNYAVKEGYMSAEEALELVAKQDWKEVYEMMDKGDSNED